MDVVRGRNRSALAWSGPTHRALNYRWYTRAGSCRVPCEQAGVATLL